MAWTDDDIEFLRDQAWRTRVAVERIAWIVTAWAILSVLAVLALTGD